MFNIGFFFHDTFSELEKIRLIFKFKTICTIATKARKLHHYLSAYVKANLLPSSHVGNGINGYAGHSLL